MACEAHRLTSRAIVAAGVGLGLLLSFAAADAAAQTYPVRPVRLLVGFAPGGSIDTMARVIAQELAARIGGSFVVENRTGAAGNIASAAVAHAEPDGHMLLMAPIAFAINAALKKSPGFDPLNDFAPVTLIAASPNVIVTHPSTPAQTLAEFIAYAKGSPGKLNYSSSGPGSSTHLAGALLAQLAGVEMVHVPYNGGQAVMAVVRNEVAVNVASVPAALGLIQGGLLKALATTGPIRLGTMPNLPTVMESGLAYDYRGWFGLLAPKGTPRPVIERLHAAIIAALKSPEVIERLSHDAAEPMGGNAEEFEAFMKREIAVWTRVAVDVGLASR